MDKNDLKERTKQFALRVVRLCTALPSTQASRVVGGQLLRSGTSVGSNYRAACRARSRADFISKIGIVEEEADESAFWLELLIESGTMPKRRLSPLLTEANEICAIAARSGRTAKQNSKRTGE